MLTPLVSIFITSYNQEETIEDCVLSAINQDYENLEIVVSDDYSKDGTRKILTNLKKSYPNKLILILNNTNKGIPQNHNTALLECRGEYVASLDGDDIFLPGKISTQVKFMEENPKCIISYHDVKVKNLDNTSYKWSDRYGIIEGDYKSMIRYGPFIPSPSVMLRRSAIPIKGYYEKVGSGADWYFWVQTLKIGRGSIKFIDKELAYYFRHDSNITLDWDKKLNSRFLIAEKIKKYIPDAKKELKMYKSDLFLMKSIRDFVNLKFFLFLKNLFISILLSFPQIWNIFRLPTRELTFIIRQNGRIDNLISSLISKK